MYSTTGYYPSSLPYLSSPSPYGTPSYGSSSGYGSSSYGASPGSSSRFRDSTSMLRTSSYDGYSAPSGRFREAFSSAKRSYGPTVPASSVSNSSAFRASSRAPMLRSMSVSPTRSSYAGDVLPTRSMFRDSFDESSASSSSSSSISAPKRNASMTSRFARAPSMAARGHPERTRDELIDSIVHTRTREHRVMPGFLTASNWEERRQINIDCDKVYPGIFLANGETIQNMDYLKGTGVTHILNTAERHVAVNPSKYPLHNISYFGFHVDDHPSANIAKHFHRTADFLDDALKRNGVIIVNCVMGWSRSATIVAAFLMSKKGMTSSQALETIRQHRPIRPNPGFLSQLASYENLLNKKLVWT